ncbi:MAG TPA: hypothetical protein VFU82_09330 [Gammaproteobacteria bacterium]|nr:hypothetical protein [Gammaproteobacteria bacterium]
MIWLNLLCLFAALFDGLLLYGFFRAGLALPAFIALHALSGVIVCLGFHVIKHKLKYYTHQMMLLFYALTFFIPIFGIIASYTLILWLKHAHRHYKNTKIKSMRLTYINKPLRIRYGMGGLHLRLMSPTANMQSKISAITKSLTVSPSRVNNLVRTMLSDNNDEVRLLAFQILNKQERKLMPKINQAIQSLQSATHPNQQYVLEKKLAFDYWELLYRALIEPHMADFAIKKTLGYGEAALEKQPNDVTLLTLLGRLSLKCNDRMAALSYFNQAIVLGEFIERILPYLAEIAYQQRQFHAIKAFFNTSTAIPNIYLNKAQYQFWNATHES